MARHSWAAVCAFLLCLVYVQGQGPAQGQDQLGHFCRRHSHRTALVDGKLYIDGGYVNYNYNGAVTSDTVNYTNTQLLYADTTSVTNYNFPPQYANLTKPQNVPSLAGGTIWADEVNRKFYLFGGQYTNISAQSVPLGFTDLYWYDTLENRWATIDASSSNISPPSYGASAVDPNKGVAYYYGGWTSNATLSGQTNATMQNTFLYYDMPNNIWNTNAFSDSTPRAEGAMFYIPAGDAGMLVYFGGVQQNSSSNLTTGSPMSTIYLYDIAAGKWYSQQTSGQTPARRRRFCGGVSWPNDTSSYNIYLFGGLQPEDEGNDSLGDAWILSLPSFTWTLYYPYGNDGSGHHSLSCDVVNNGQMIVMGGWFSNSSNTACDAPEVFGMHNMNLGLNNRDQVPWYQFQLNLTEYTVPPNLTAVIGGSDTGSATVQSPTPTGFSKGNGDLSRLFALKASTSTRPANRPIPTATSSSNATKKSSTNVGAIAGGVVGGVVGLALLIGAIVLGLCLRRRRQAKKNRAANTAEISTGTSNEMREVHEVHQTPIAEAPDNAPVQPHNQGHKRDASDTTVQHGWAHTPIGSPNTGHTSWQSVPPYNNQQQHFREDLPGQQPYYPPPTQAQTYYPPPPQPEQHIEHDPPSPLHEMPNVRSPVNGSSSPRVVIPRAWTPSTGAKPTIDEEQ